jgi:hypothetical protein
MLSEVSVLVLLEQALNRKASKNKGAIRDMGFSVKGFTQRFDILPSLKKRDSIGFNKPRAVLSFDFLQGSASGR